MKTEKEIREQLEQLEKELLQNANCMIINANVISPIAPISIIMDAYLHDMLLTRICQLRSVLNIEDKNK